MFSGIIIAATLLEMSANGIELKIDSERTVIDPGRSVILQVELKSPPGKTALLPDLRDRVEGFTLAEDFTDEPKNLKDGSLLQTANWRLVPEPCAERYKIRPFVIKASPKMMSYQSDEGSLSFVAGPIRFENPPPRESVTGEMETNPKKDFPPISWRLAGVAVLLLAIIALGVYALFYLAKYITRRVKEHRMSPVERAMAELKRLLGKGLPGRGKYKDFYIELTHVVRRYVQRQHGVRAPHLTTEEFFEQAKRASTFNQEALNDLIEFLQKADMVKFAGVQATPETADEATESAKTFISNDASAQQGRKNKTHQSSDIKGEYK